MIHTCRGSIEREKHSIISALTYIILVSVREGVKVKSVTIDADSYKLLCDDNSTETLVETPNGVICVKV